MADLIERDALVSLWKPLADRDCFAGNVIASCLNELNAQPTVDAAPVVHGAWADGECDDGGELWYCNRCGYPVKTIAGRPAFNFCPNCGAKMDGGAPCE